MPRPDVVQHHQESVTAQRVRERAEAPHVLEARLEELDRHVARQQVRLPHQRRERRRQRARIRRVRGEIQVQKQQQLVGARRQAGEASDRGLAAKPFQLGAQIFGRRRLEEIVRGDQPAVRRSAAGQRLHPDDALLPNREDRLEMRRDRSVSIRCRIENREAGGGRFGDELGRRVESHVGVGGESQGHRRRQMRHEDAVVELTNMKHSTRRDRAGTI